MTTPVAWPTGLSKTRAARPQAGLLIVPKSKIKQQHGAVDEMAVLPGGNAGIAW